MLPFRQIGEAKPEQWVGLIDAVYAISMTLLALLLPDMLSDSFRLFEKTQTAQFLLNAFYHIAFYFLTLLILYEVWCFHRSILVLSNSKNRRQNIYTGLMLGVVCLATPWGGAILEFSSQLWIESELRTALGTFGWLLVFLMYFLLYLIGRSSQDFREIPSLRLITKEAKNRSFFFAAIVVLNSIRIVDSRWPHVPAVLIFSIYVLVSFNQDRVTGVLKRMPGLLRQR